VLGEGRVQACLVGGIDALADLRWLDALHTLGLLTTPVDPVGITPGEAAAFLCVETARAAEARGATILAVLGEPAVGRDPSDRLADTPPLGAVLADVIRAALGAHARAAPQCLAGLGGDARAAAEWGRAWVRLQPHTALGEVAYPATAFGDTGAASGFVSAGVALHAFARRTAPSGAALVWSASDDGLRGAFTLADAAHG
jgi:3-oxoacyl-[acyl-carrier-protein] synthase-1